MSNRALRDRIAYVLAAYRKGETTLVELRDTLIQNGRALEAMPYHLIKQIDDLEFDLTSAQFAEDEDCVSDLSAALGELETWLSSVPIESDAEPGARR